MTNAISLTERLRVYMAGDSGAADALLREILPKLREVAVRELRKERPCAPVSPTELIHEIWLRNLSRATWNIRDRAHFFAIASLAMRRVLIDLARKRLAEQRNMNLPMRGINGDTAAGALQRSAQQILEIGMLMIRLDEQSSDLARIIDMHYFAGFTFAEIGENCHLTDRQVRTRWNRAMKWFKIHSRKIRSTN